MKTDIHLRKLVAFPLLIIIGTLYGCGAAHVRTEMASPDLHQYGKVFISDVRVYSKEEAAKDNVELQAKMREWELFARNELEGYVKNSHYQLIDQIPSGTQQILFFDLDINLTYGNRALRYWVGFGAGKGGVYSVLTASDSKTGEEKLRAVAESDLAMGAFGGDMQTVLKDNIKKLVDQYPAAPQKASHIYYWCA